MAPAPDRTNPTPPHMLGHVLHPDELLTRVAYGSTAPDARLSRWVERYWSVQWDFADGEVYRPATLDDPSIHLTLERGGARREGAGEPGSDAWWITGPVTRGRFDVELTGTGSVVGVKFRVGGTLAFLDADLRALRDRTIPGGDWFGEGLPPRTIAEDAAGAATMLDRWLLARDPVEPAGQREFDRVLEIMADPAVTGLGELCARSGLGERQVQRLVGRFTGMAPKRMLVRARVSDALAAIDGGDPRDLAEIAGELGWFDQSHFIRDVRRVIGETPARYARHPALARLLETATGHMTGGRR